MEDTKTNYTRKLKQAKERHIEALKELASALKMAYNKVDSTIVKNQHQPEEKPAWFVFGIECQRELREIAQAEAEIRMYQEVLDALKWQDSERQNA